MSANKKTPAKHQSVAKQQSNMKQQSSIKPQSATTPVKSTSKKVSQTIISQSKSQKIQNPTLNNKKKNSNILSQIKNQFICSVLQNMEKPTSLSQSLYQIIKNYNVQTAITQIKNLFKKQSLSLSAQNSEQSLIKQLKKLNYDQLNGLIYLLEQIVITIKQNTSQTQQYIQAQYCGSLLRCLFCISRINKQLVYGNEAIKRFVYGCSQKSIQQSSTIESIKGKIQFLGGY